MSEATNDTERPFNPANLYVGKSREHEGQRAVYEHVDEGPHPLVADDFNDATAANRWIAYQQGRREA